MTLEAGNLDVLFVADSGMNSEKKREELTRTCGKYLLACRMASVVLGFGVICYLTHPKPKFTHLLSIQKPISMSTPQIDKHLTYSGEMINCKVNHVVENSGSSMKLGTDA